MEILKRVTQITLLGVCLIEAQVLTFAEDTQAYDLGEPADGVEFNGTEITVSRTGFSSYRAIPLALEQPYEITSNTIVAFEIKEEGNPNFIQGFAVENRDVTVSWRSPFPAMMAVGFNFFASQGERSSETSDVRASSWVFAENYFSYGVEEQVLPSGWIRYSVNVNQLLSNRSLRFSNPDSISGFHLGFVGGDETTKVTYRNFRIYEETETTADFGTLAVHEDLWVDGNIYLAGELFRQDGGDLFNELLAKARLEPQGDISMGIFGSQSAQ